MDVARARICAICICAISGEGKGDTLINRLSTLGLATAFLAAACGGEPATQAPEQPSETPSADSEPGVTDYNNGQVSFAKSGEGASSVIRFARARMAWEDCVIAGN